MNLYLKSHFHHNHFYSTYQDCCLVPLRKLIWYLGIWEFNVISTVHRDARSNDIPNGLNLLSEHAPDMIERTLEIFLLKAINQFRRFKPSESITKPCQLEPEITDILRLCHWYYKCWDIGNKNFLQFKPILQIM
jgi:hypothetical protein